MLTRKGQGSTPPDGEGETLWARHFLAYSAFISQILPISRGTPPGLGFLEESIMGSFNSVDPTIEPEDGVLKRRFYRWIKLALCWELKFACASAWNLLERINILPRPDSPNQKNSESALRFLFPPRATTQARTSRCFHICISLAS